MTERSNKPWLTDQYRDYLLTDEWQLVRAAALARANYQCAECGKPNELQVHHRHYRTLGNEQPGDVIVLCEWCHDLAHRRISAARLDDRRLDGWASKKWGENWSDFVDPDVAQRQFDDWLERRGDRW